MVIHYIVETIYWANYNRTRPCTSDQFILQQVLVPAIKYQIKPTLPGRFEGEAIGINDLREFMTALSVTRRGDLDDRFECESFNSGLGPPDKVRLRDLVLVVPVAALTGSLIRVEPSKRAGSVGNADMRSCFVPLVGLAGRADRTVMEGKGCVTVSFDVGGPSAAHAAIPSG